MAKLFLRAGSRGVSSGPIWAEEPALFGAGSENYVGGVRELALPETLGALLNLALHMVQPDPLPTPRTECSSAGMTRHLQLPLMDCWRRVSDSYGGVGLTQGLLKRLRPS